MLARSTASNGATAQKQEDEARRIKFENAAFGKMRVVMRDGEPWFVAKDVLDALEYPETTMSNIGKAIQHVPDVWRCRYPIPTAFGVKDMSCLSEQGVYFFLGRSDKPKAIPFQMWHAGEVVPSIRKTGGYGIAADPSVLALGQEIASIREQQALCSAPSL